MATAAGGCFSCFFNFWERLCSYKWIEVLYSVQFNVVPVTITKYQNTFLFGSRCVSPLQDFMYSFNNILYCNLKMLYYV